jgi:hypothetical protein
MPGLIATHDYRLTYIDSEGSKRDFQRIRDIDQLSGPGRPWWILVMTPNSALVNDAYAAALRASFSASQRER